MVAGTTPSLPWLVVDAAGREIEPVSVYLRDRMLGDASTATCRSYGYDLLRWHRVLWALDVGWNRSPRPRPPYLWAGCGMPTTLSVNGDASAVTRPGP
ncbi:hypothetical protein [Streptomyces gardneri]|uniref:hypothetical protein n=1 Tax=Streptomyces gardneri TaxID=66892 RepID=UPI00280C3405|nr:hypothetical protein [Streptomyces gardneri]